ncbi:MAG: hypothetical protein GY796_31490 [Chloroflexi bacterium]|nr:hypothetical protein [Chloroflexota bacterium]
MFTKKRYLLILGLLFIAIVALVACESEPVEVTRVVEVEVEVPGETVEVEVPGETIEVEVEVTRVVEVMVEPEMETAVVSVIPYEEEWANSPHNNKEAEAFIHWDEDDPAEIPTSCAKCHSTPGYLDFIGADGSEVGVVDVAAPLGTTVECAACHNDTTAEMTSVTFPSGIEVMGLGDESRCIQCHQGRSSTVKVNEGIIEAGLDPVADLDTVSEEVGFSNIHYFAAAATQYGTTAMGGYEYDGKAYDAKFDHVEEYDACIDCHSSHTLEVQFDDCTQCHEGLESTDDLINIRMEGSLVDYDGDGDMEEGIAFEIEGMRDMLYQAIQAYAAETTGTAVAYDSHSYPYFFIDTNGDGEAGEDEANYGNQYNAWTPRLAQAAYNYQTSLKDPGQFAHGGKYIIQLLYDSIESLNETIASPVDLSAASRIDHGHFAGSEEAFRHWDEDGAVPGSCSKCHSAAGLPLFAEQGVTINQPPANGLNCATCHNDLDEYTLYQTADVTFPSGATVSFAIDEEDEDGLAANLCINCHQGRSSTPSVDRGLAGLEDDTPSDAIRFSNIHYFAAGATLFGTEVQGAYEFADQTYVGRYAHVGDFNTCIECHSTHELEVKYADCTECHENVVSPEDLAAVRTTGIDYDGDGDVTEGLAGELDTMGEALYAALLAYASANSQPIVYDSHSYPYFFIDTNGDGVPTPDEANYGNRYNAFTPNMLRAAYNYQYLQKDPGAYTHNGFYVMQVLYDSINAVGGDTSGMTRPDGFP